VDEPAVDEPPVDELDFEEAPARAAPVADGSVVDGPVVAGPVILDAPAATFRATPEFLAGVVAAGVAAARFAGLGVVLVAPEAGLAAPLLTGAELAFAAALVLGAAPDAFAAAAALTPEVLVAA